MVRVSIIMLTTVLLLSCGGSDSDKMESDHFNNKVIPYDSTIEQSVAATIPENNLKLDTTFFKDNSNEILLNIDRYLVSESKFTLLNTGEGFHEAVVSLKNTFPDITIQKALLEVSILTADNKEYRTDYYTLQNIETGDIKYVKVPKSSRGVKISSHVVKLKSDILTNGQMKLVGEKYTNK